MNGIIYLLTFPDDTFYIGRTIRPIKQRIKEHQKRWNCEFEFHILESGLTTKQLDLFEPFYLSLFNANGNSGRNIDTAEKKAIKRKVEYNKLDYTPHEFEKMMVLWGDEYWKMCEGHKYEKMQFIKEKINIIREQKND